MELRRLEVHNVALEAYIERGVGRRKVIEAWHMHKRDIYRGVN